ncbi:FMN reductase [Sphaerisporangium rufum]|uniref:FMN reductase n=1 Tax=Sphaerisporangium rufum TaxID=1381558 RepID=A0A919R589_9ACTN|nr:NAD(P)H-dependent oxidoreductase [Sphaerisporangium rufum]GII79774.1 FMN reductase [Sphaerisporangium rufum]
MIRIAVILGSTRPGRRGAAVARWIVAEAGRHPDAVAGDVVVEPVDLADFDLPLLDEPSPARFGDYRNPHTRRWSEAVASFDGFVFVTPEYNHSMPAALKNAIDYLCEEWQDKAAGFVGYGADGGVRAIEHLRPVMAELRVADVQAQVTLGLFADFEIESPTDPGRLTPRPHQQEALAGLLDQVIAWSRALAPLRAGRRVAQPASTG